MKVFGFMLAAMILHCPVQAALRVSGNITQDTTWGLTSPSSDGTYVVSGGVLGIEGGASLTIEPGVVVKIGNRENPKAQWKATGAIEGKIVAVGIRGKRITFTSVDDDSIGGKAELSDGIPQPGDYWHILPGVGSKLSYCDIKYCAQGVVIECNDPALKIDNCRFDLNKRSIYASKSSCPVIVDNIFKGGDWYGCGIGCANNAMLTIKNNIVDGTGNAGRMIVTGINPEDSVSVDAVNNTFVNCRACCIEIHPGCGETTVRNNIFAYVKRYAVAGTTTNKERIVISHNCLFNVGEATSYYRYGSQGGDIKVDPLFEDYEKKNYRLKPESPCLKSGYEGADIGCKPQ